MKTLITIIGITLSSCLFAQPSFEWGSSFGGSSQEYGASVVSDNSENVIIGGTLFNSASPIDMNPGAGLQNITTNGSTDGYVSKFDQNGNFEWVLHINGVNSDDCQMITTDSNDNIYAVGSFSGTVDFDPGPGIFNMTASGSSTSFIIKIGTTGNLIWAKQLASAVSRAISIDDNNNVLVTGQYGGTNDFDPGLGVFNLTSIGSIDCFVLKLDSNGDFVWVKSLGGTSVEYGYDIDQAGSNGIIIVGSFQGTCDFDPDAGAFNLTSNGSSDGFAVMLDANGSFIWAYQVGGVSNDNIIKSGADQNGNVYLAGNFTSIVDFDSGPGTFNLSASSVDGFVLKLGVSGNFEWAFDIGGSSNDFTYDINVTPTSELLIVGTFDGTVDLDPGPGVSNMISSGMDDGYLAKYDLLGNLLFAYQFTGASIQTPYSVHTNSSGVIAVSGHHYSNSDIDPTSGTLNVTSNGSSDAFVIKLNECINSNSVFSVFDCTSYTVPSGDETYTAIGSYQVMDTIPNTCGLDSIMTIDLTIEDILAPDVATLTNLTDECEVTSLTAPTATDNCVGSVTGTHSVSLPITSTTTITWTYDDGNGNTSTQTQEVIIDDVTAPVADVAGLPDVTAQCEVTSLTAPTATDNCVGSVSGTHSATLPITSTTTITWTYDDGNGNTSTQTQEVIIDDVTAPVADVASLSDVTAQCEVTSLTAPTATDNCVGSVSGTHSATLPITSTTTITWTYDDGNGNTSTQTQEVIIDDVTAPMADVASLSDVTADCEVTSLTAPTATDNCAGSITGTHNASLPITAQGTTTVTWTYDDGNGNTSTQTQDVVITDATAPAAAVANLSDINSECEVTPAAPSATDNCTGAVTGTPDVSFPITATGTTTVTWTYNDGNGNTSTQTQDVVITPIDNSVSVVDDITLSADASGYTYQWVDCNDNNSPIAGETAQTFEATANGSYAVIIDNGTCDVTSSCFDITTVGLGENQIDEISVFPNPTSGAVTINSSAQFNRVVVINVMGQLVYSTSLNEVSTHQIELPEAKGVYLIKVSGNNTSKTFRIIKN